MVLLGSVLTAFALASGSLAAPSAHPRPAIFDRSLLAQANGNTPNGQGIWWHDNFETNVAIFDKGPKGSYTMDWKVEGNILGGTGWATGAPRNITFSADWKTVNNSNGYLSVYGETTKPNAEYYIIESHGSYNPGSNPNAKFWGTNEVDGAIYKIYESIMVFMNRPALRQYWAIREEMRTSGTVDVGKIFDIWAGYGMKLEEFGMQILATEGYRSAGRSEVNISSPA